ncbi:MAG: DNA adenine methylase [Thermoplasmatota archaeon]
MPQLALVEQLPRRPSGGVAPPLKWAGGKRWLVPHLRPLWAPHREARLIEPFAGGLAMTLDFQPRRALVNDYNVHLINFYTWLQKGLKIDVPSGTDATTYYANRNRFNELIRTGRATSKQAAMLFYYLNRNCYNGLCRFNRSGEFNTPHGRYKNPQFLEDLTPYKEPFANWTFQSGDFENVRLRKTDFVFADPPYDNAFTSYSVGEFSWNDQERLAQWLAEHDGPVVASNHATPRIVELYQSLGFNLKTLPAPRMINCTGDRTPVMEMVASRNL